MDADRLARARLTFLAEPEDIAVLNEIIDVAGPVGALTAVLTDAVPDFLDDRSMAMARQAMARWQKRLKAAPDADQVKRWEEEDGIRLVCPRDAEWPEQVTDLGDQRPFALWARGPAELQDTIGKSVAIVGSRAASAYGSHMASELASGVAGRGWTVISGAAYGVDGTAHMGALTVYGATIAVMACGVDIAYPAGHKDLLGVIGQDHAIVSEWPPGCRPSRLRFLYRNRIIAALARGTVVVEAGERSGSMNTARWARELRRPLMAVPGPVTSQQSRGCHLIIRDLNGTLVTTPGEVIQAASPFDPAPLCPDGE